MTGIFSSENIHFNILLIYTISFSPLIISFISFKQPIIQRSINSKNVYKLKNLDYQKIQQKSVLIFDDIYTTGSTVNECSRVIKVAGAKGIAVLTIAVD